jgi:hypothetical protein
MGGSLFPRSHPVIARANITKTFRKANKIIKKFMTGCGLKRIPSE